MVQGEEEDGRVVFLNEKTSQLEFGGRMKVCSVGVGSSDGVVGRCPLSHRSRGASGLSDLVGSRVSLGVGVASLVLCCLHSLVNALCVTLPGEFRDIS